MATNFRLIGHDDPLGYPGPVVPIGFRNGKLIAVYASDRVTELPFDKKQSFVKHTEKDRHAIRAFDHMNERLFALSANRLEKYAIDSEQSYFLSLLARKEFGNENPFVRLCLAKAVNSREALYLELFISGTTLNKIGPTRFIDVWYEQQKKDIAVTFGPMVWIYFPERWYELDAYLSATQYEFLYRYDPTYVTSDDNKFGANSLSNLERLTASDVAHMKNGELIENYAKFRVTQPEAAAVFFEALLNKYLGLIQDLVWYRKNSLPDWISVEDVVSQVIINLFAELNQSVNPKELVVRNMKRLVEKLVKNEIIAVRNESRRKHSLDSYSAYTFNEPTWQNLERITSRPAVEGSVSHTKSEHAEFERLVSMITVEVCRSQFEAALFNDFLDNLSVSDIARKYAVQPKLIRARLESLKKRVERWLNDKGMLF